MAEEYVPGVCNIGPAERRQRRMVGIAGAAVSIVLLLLLLWFRAPRPVRFVLVFPVAMAAMGFLQDAFHFCAAYGMRGVFNVARSVGRTDDVATEEFRRQDRKKALVISALGIGAGIIVAGAAVLL